MHIEIGTESVVGGLAKEQQIRLFIGNLVWNINEDEIFNHCGRHDAIENIEIKRFKNYKSRGWGLIYLKRDASDADGQDIIDAYNFSELKDRKIHIKFDRDNDNCKDTRLYVGNIPWAYTGADVKEILKDYNPISVKVTTNMVGKSRGYALVRFENPDTVFQVIKENENIVWRNRTILLKIDNKFADTDAEGHTTQDSCSHETTQDSCSHET